MGKYDAERAKLRGGTASPSPASQPVQSASKYARERQSIVSGPPAVEQPLAEQVGKYQPMLDDLSAPEAADSWPRLRTDLPGGWMNPANAINAFRNSPVGTTVDRFAQSAGRAMGLNDSQMSPKAETGNSIVDGAADIAGSVAGYFVNPGQLSQGVGSVYRAAAPYAERIGGKLAERLLPDAGLTLNKAGNVADSLATRVVKEGLQEGMTGAAYGVNRELMQGENDLGEIVKGGLTEGVLGLATGGVMPVLGAGLRGAREGIADAAGRLRPEAPLRTPDYSNIGFDRSTTLDPMGTAGRKTVQGYGPNDFTQRFEFANRQYGTDQPLGLPEPARDARIRAARERSKTEYGADPIQGEGDIYTFALPEASDYSRAAKYRDDFINRRTGKDQPLGLPEPERISRLRNAENRRIQDYGAEPIHAEGDIYTYSLPEPPKETVNRYNFMNRQLGINQPLGLPDSRRDVRLRNAESRGVNEYGSKPIESTGKVHTYSLPQPSSERVGQYHNINDAQESVRKIETRIKQTQTRLEKDPTNVKLQQTVYSLKRVRDDIQTAIDDFMQVRRGFPGEGLKREVIGVPPVKSAKPLEPKPKQNLDSPSIKPAENPKTSEIPLGFKREVIGFKKQQPKVDAKKPEKKPNPKSPTKEKTPTVKPENAPVVGDFKTEVIGFKRQTPRKGLQQDPKKAINKPAQKPAQDPKAVVKGKPPTAQPKQTPQKPVQAPKEVVQGKVIPEQPKAPVQPKQTPQTAERANFNTQQQSGMFSKELNERLSKVDRTYEVLPNEKVVAKSKAKSKKDLDDMQAKFLGRREYSAEHVSDGYELMQELDKLGRYDDALNVAEKLAKDLTKAGQTVQAASIIKRLSPEGQLIHLTRQASKNGKKVDAADARVFSDLAKDVQTAIGSGKKTADFMDILNRIKSGKEVKPDELKQATTILKEAQRYLKTEKPPNVPKEMKSERVRDKVLSSLEKRAEAARKEWESKRNLGFAQQLKKPDMVLLAEMGAYELAKKMVNLADFTEIMVKQFGDSIRPNIQEVYNQARELLGKTAKISDKQVSAAEKVMEKMLKDGKISADDEKLLRDLAKQISELDKAKGIEADMKMQRIMNKYEKADLGSRIATLRYIAMLLNTGTQGVNAISGPMMMVWNHMLDVMATPLDLIYSSVTKSARTTTFKQGPGLADGVWDSVKDWFKGLKVGGKAGWLGVDPEGIATQHDIRGLSFKGKYNPLGGLERTLGAVAKGPDYATFSTARNVELRKIAYLDAINSGIKGKENIRRHMDEFLANPDNKSMEQAARAGKKITFQNTEGVAGKAANAARSMNAITGSKDFGFANIIVPFVRTPTNIAITGIENSPAGVLKGLFEIYRLRNGAEDVSKREILKTFVSATAGGTATLGSLGYILSSHGIITGDYSSSDSNVQELQDMIGKGKFKFNTSAFGRMMDSLLSGDVKNLKQEYREGDKQIDYNRLQPLAFPLAAGATFQQGEGKPLGERAGAAGRSSLSSLFGMSALQGIQQNFRTEPGAKGSEVALQIGQNIGENLVKSFSPSALGQEARRQDPIQRKVSYGGSFKEDVGTYWQSRTPGLSQNLPPRQTTLGDTRENTPGVVGQYLNPLRSEKPVYNEAAKIIDEVIKSTGDESLAPKPVDKTIRGTKKGERESTTVKLDKKRYAKLQEDVGLKVSERIMRLSPNLSDYDKARRIEQIYRDVEEIERNKLKREMGFRP